MGVTRARSSGVALLRTMMRTRTRTRAWAWTRTRARARTTTTRRRKKKSRSRRTKGTAEGTGHAEPLTPSAANSPMAHMTARMSNLAEDVVGVGAGVEAGAAALGERRAGVEAGAAAVGERPRLALMCRTTVTIAATTENLCLSVDVAEDVGVAEGVGDVGVVEPTLGCLAGGAMVEPSSGCAAVGDVGVVELLSRCVAEAVGAVAVDVGVALDDHYHRSINGRPISRQNESVCISGDKTLGDKTLDQIPPRRPIASSVDLLAPLGSTWSSIDSWTLSHAPIARHAFGRKSELWVRRRTLLLVCAAAKAKSLFPSSRVVHLNKRSIGLDNTGAAKEFRRNARAYNSVLCVQLSRGQNRTTLSGWRPGPPHQRSRFP